MSIATPTTITTVPAAVIPPPAVERSLRATAYARVVVGATKKPSVGQNQLP
jgi:hypothetical protein